MRLVYGETSVLLQGDSTARIEQYLGSKDGTALKSTILKIGHHGSRTSSTEEYVADVAPQFAVISSGKDNSYGHPHKETLDTLSSLKIPAYDTCNNGRIIWKSDGKTFVLKNKNIKEAVVGCKAI
jgi:competence protein ComEC